MKTGLKPLRGLIMKGHKEQEVKTGPRMYIILYVLWMEVAASTVRVYDYQCKDEGRGSKATPLSGSRTFTSSPDLNVDKLENANKYFIIYHKG